MEVSAWAVSVDGAGVGRRVWNDSRGVVEVFGPLEALEAFSARLRTEAPPPTAAIREIQSRAIPGEAFRSSSSFLARVGRERSRCHVIGPRAPPPRARHGHAPTRRPR